MTSEGYIIPLHVHNCLFYMDKAKPISSDLNSYPHCIITSNATWDPSLINEEFLYSDDDVPVVTKLHETHDHCLDAFGDHISNYYAVLQSWMIQMLIPTQSP